MEAHAVTRSARSDLPDVIRDARFQDIARRIIQGQSPREIAEAHGMTVRAVHLLRSDARFVAIYREVSSTIWGDTDELIKNEKADVALRRAALQSRAMTLLGEVMEAAQAHISDAEKQTGSKGSAKSTMLRAAVEATREVTNINRETGAGGKRAAVVQNFLVSGDVAGTIRDAIRESGIDISDILDAEITDVEDATAEDSGDPPANE